MTIATHEIERNAAPEGGILLPGSLAGAEPAHDLPFTIEKPVERKERVAGGIAAALFVLLALEILIFLGGAMFLENFEPLKEAFQVVFPVTAGFFATAVTYYYKSDRR